MIHMFIKNNGGIPVNSRERTYELTFDRSYFNLIKLLSIYSKCPRRLMTIIKTKEFFRKLMPGST